MKRALSLIIVLAMVLCMIPFSAFAADFGIAGDFADGVITLVAGEEQTYLYTATEDGTVEVFAEAVVPEVAEGEEVPALAEPYILVDGAEYTEAFAVTAGQSYEITFGDNAMIGGDVTVYTVFKGLPGTETNPYEIYNPASGMGDGNTTTVEVAAGESVYYNLYYYTGCEVTIAGNGVAVVKGEETVDGSKTGSVTFTFGANENVALIQITNKSDAAATYVVSAVAPNSNTNPDVVSNGEYTANLTAGDDGYYYAYTAEGDGTVTITVNAADAEGNAVGWMFQANNVTKGTYGDMQFSDAESVVNTVAVSAGDRVEVMVNTYNPADMWGNPAATVTTTFAFEAAAEEPEGPIVIESLPYEVTHTGNHEQAYSYTATEAGYLYVTTSDGVDGGYVNFNVWGSQPYGDGFVLAMDADANVEITLASYWSAEDAVVNYTFSWMTEVEPDGSEGFPFIVDTILPDGKTLTNDGEDAVYYSYVAEKNGEIYNSFWESATPVAAGETMSIYVPAGQSVNVAYLPAVAMIGDAEYTSLAKAAEAAVSGDTIVLVANATEEAGITLAKGVNLDLGAYTLTIPYLVALKGSVITGDLGNAVIVTEDLIANIVEIDGVEYAWTESEAGYILDVYKAPVVGTEEPIVAEYNGEQMGLNAALSAAAAVATADSRAVVTLISDATVDYNVVIGPYVTLNIAGYKLTAPNVIGLANSMINAAAPTDTTAAVANGGKIYVPSKANMVMSAEIHAGSKSGCMLMPVWNPEVVDTEGNVTMVGHYLFTNVKNAQDYIQDVAGTEGYENYTKCSVIMVKHTWSDSGVKKLINDKDSDVAENALTFTFEATWNYYDVIDVSQQYVMIGAYVDQATNGGAYGGDTGEIDGYVDYKIQFQLVSDTGAIYYGNLYTIE